MGDSQLDLMAKLDTGADTSSIHATKIRRYRSSNRELWLDFRLTDESSAGPSDSRRSWSGMPSSRSMRDRARSVRWSNMTICLGDHKKEIEVSLVDRGVFQYPVLLGRNALEGHVVVDPELSLTARPSCSPEETR